MTTARERAEGVCPVIHEEYREPGPVGSHHALLDERMAQSRFAFNTLTDRGFWMFQRYDDVVEGLQRHEEFSNDVTNALNPEKIEAFIPQSLNGEAQAKMRRIVNPYFSPAAVRRLEPIAVSHAIDMIEKIAPEGQCDIVEDFAITYPTDLFLYLLGVPMSDGDFFQPWVEKMFAGFFGGDRAEAQQAAEEIKQYFDVMIEDRKKNMLDPNTDMVSRLLQARIDDQPIPLEEVRTICLSILLAGLDTTRAALGFIFHHLATYPEDRQIILDDPSKIPNMVEEMVRLYPLVIQAGREATTDVDFHGCPISKGDVVWMGIASANHDPEKYPDPDSFQIDRPHVNQHLGFGAGIHRCLGMHLARFELAVVLREWHARIPHYRLAEGAVSTERGGQLTLDTVPLEWTP